MNKKQSNLSEGVPEANDVSHQKIEDLEVRPKGTNQSRVMPLMPKSEDYDQFHEENRLTKMGGSVGSRSTGKGA